MIIKKRATAAETAGGITSPPRAQIFRERAKSLRETAALTSGPDIRKDLENIALQYELMAQSIEPVEKSAGVENQSGDATGRGVAGSPKAPGRTG